eukprot:COSAG05_NODE_7583_length_793_cov_1.445245_2_plen_20_part_01
MHARAENSNMIQNSDACMSN